MKETFLNAEITVLLYMHGQVKAFKLNLNQCKTIESEDISKRTHYIHSRFWLDNISAAGTETRFF